MWTGFSVTCSQRLYNKYLWFQNSGFSTPHNLGHNFLCPYFSDSLTLPTYKLCLFCTIPYSSHLLIASLCQNFQTEVFKKIYIPSKLWCHSCNQPVFIKQPLYASHCTRQYEGFKRSSTKVLIHYSPICSFIQIYLPNPSWLLALF